MTVTGILSSPSQKRTFLLTSSMVLFICIIGIFMIAWFAPSTPIWNSLSSLFISSVASGVFALVAGLYIYYFFVDPNDIAAKTTILPQDIKQTLHVIALRAKDYRIPVLLVDNLDIITAMHFYRGGLNNVKVRRNY